MKLLALYLPVFLTCCTTVELVSYSPFETLPINSFEFDVVPDLILDVSSPVSLEVPRKQFPQLDMHFPERNWGDCSTERVFRSAGYFLELTGSSKVWIPLNGSPKNIYRFQIVEHYVEVPMMCP